jgi:hypothetical protein
MMEIHARGANRIYRPFAATDNPGFTSGRSDRCAIVSMGIFAAYVGREKANHDR